MNARVLRIDAVTVLRQDAEVTPEGFHLFNALYARTGTQDYDDGRGGIIVEYRPDAEVFHPDALASYELRPLTDLHPPKNVTTDTARMLARGATSAGRQHSDNRHVAGRIAVWDRSLLDKFLAAFARGDAMQLSAGYELDLDRTPGTAPDGRRYDAVQRNIRINHVAAVPLGRAGTARVLADSFANEWARFDAADYALDQAHSLADIAPNRSRVIVDFGQRWARHDAASLRIQTPDASTQDNANMKKLTIKVDGKDVAIEVADNATPDQIAQAAADASGKRDAKEYISKAEHDKAIAEAVTKAKADAMAPPFGKPKPEDEEDAKKKDAAMQAKLDAVTRDAAERLDVGTAARAVCGISYKVDGKTLEAMRLDVIETVAGRDERDGAALRKKLEALPAGKRDGAIAFAFDEAIDTFQALPTHADNLLGQIRGRFEQEQKNDGKPREAGPITKTRADAEAEAALPRHERTAARKAG